MTPRLRGRVGVAAGDEALVPIDVQILAEHIAEGSRSDGRRSDPMLSPPALAIDRVTTRGYAWVSRRTARLMEQERVVSTLVLPPALVAWLARFDRGEAVEPTTFTIALPRNWVRERTMPCS